MSKATTANPNRRSWTDGQSAPSNRKSMLAFLSISVAILTIFFCWFVINWGKKDETFLLSLSVSDYGKNISKANYGVWDETSFQENLSSHGLKPWTFSEKKPIQNWLQMQDRLTSFVAELKKKGRDPENTTVLIQLRCHAVVTHDGTKGYCGLPLGEADGDDAITPFVKLLDELKEVRADNILLFADVCDLKTVANQGWLSNPVTTYIEKACGEWKNSTNKNLWVVCAADDYQDTFSSNLREKTLFQLACEDAVQPGLKKDLNLFDYFESLFRYCNTASGGLQTPKLIWANGTRTVTLSAESKPDIEKIAKEVLLSGKSRMPSVPANVSKPKKDSQTSSAKTTTSTFLPNRAKAGFSRLVSMSQSSPGAESTASKLQADVGEITWDSDERLAFWQIRDRILSRKSTTSKMRWSPTDFAPMLWRKWQNEAANDPVIAKTHFNELQVLDSLLDGTLPKEDARAKNQKLVQAWNDFLENKQLYLRLWQGEDDVLNQAESTAWTAVRSKYRDYIDSISELAFWYALDSEDPLFWKEFEELIACLEKAKMKLPEEPNESAIERSIDMQLGPAIQARQSLRKWLANRCTELESKKTALSWIDEREYQTLLASPLLSYDQRKALVSQLDGKKKNLDEVRPDRDTEFTKLLEQTPPSASKVERSVNALVRMASLCTPKIPLPEKGNSDPYLLYGKVFESAMQRESSSSVEADPKSQIRRWHFLSLADTNFADPVTESKSFAGMIVSPVNPKAIRLSLPPKIASLDFADTNDETELRVNVKRVDESNVEECLIQWSTSAEFPNFIISINGKTCPKNSPTKINPRNKQAILVCQFPRLGKIPDGLKLNLTLVGEKSASLSVPVFRDTDQIDIVATRVSKLGKLLDRIDSDENKELQFSGPAIAGTTNRFEFALRNKKTKARRAKLQVFVIPGLDIPAPDPQSFLLAESDIVALPASAQAVRVALLASKDHLKPMQIESARDSSLVFKIVEYELESAAGNQDAAQVKGKPFEYVGRFNPERPFQKKYIQAIAGEVKDGKQLSVEFEAAPDFFEKYEVAVPIPISANIALISGDKELSSEKKSGVLASNKLKADIRGPVMEAVRSYRLAFDIGGFPRAVVYIANPKFDKLEEENHQQIVVAEIVAKRKDKPPEKLIQVNDLTIVPNRIRVGEEFEIANWESIEIQTRIDKRFQDDVLKMEVVGASGIAIDSREFQHDRRYHAELAIDAALGTIQIAYNASELRLQPFRVLNDSLKEIYSVKLSFAGENLITSKIIFDRDRPEPGARIICSEPEPVLFEGEALEISIEPKDTGSGIQAVEFARVSGNVDRPSYASLEAEKLDRINVSYEGGRAKFLVDSKDLLKRPSGDYFLVARSIDRAGNYQDDNIAIKFRWKAAKRIPPSK